MTPHPRWEDVKDPISVFADDELWARLPKGRIAEFVSRAIRIRLPFPVSDGANGMPALPDLGSLYRNNPETQKKRVLSIDRKSHTIFKVYLACYKSAYQNIDQSKLLCTLIDLALREGLDDGQEA